MISRHIIMAQILHEQCAGRISRSHIASKEAGIRSRFQHLSMSAVEAFKTELSAMQAMLLKQQGKLTQHGFAKLLAAQSNEFAEKAKKLVGTQPADVNELTDVLDTCAQWEEIHKSTICQALCDAQQAPSVATAAGTKKENDPAKNAWVSKNISCSPRRSSWLINALPPRQKLSSSCQQCFHA